MKLRELKDCFKPNPLAERKIVFKNYKINFLKCVGNYRLPEWDEIYQLYESRKSNGLNPFGSVFVDIPSRNLDVFYLIDSLVNMEINKKRK